MSTVIASEQEVARLAGPLRRSAQQESRPRSAQVHVLLHADGAQLFLADGSRLYDVSAQLGAEFLAAMHAADETAIMRRIEALGLSVPARIDDAPLAPMPAHALSLAVAQKCNLGCTYCYAQQGAFGGAAKNMPLATALQAIDLLLAGAERGGKVNLSFLGGEPLQNRAVLREATEYAAQRARERDIRVGFSITTNGTLLKPADADFFEQHGFAVTVSLDGPAAQHDRLRPLKNGRGSFGRILRQIEPLLRRQRRMQVSARVTVTPLNLDLPATLGSVRWAGLSQRRLFAAAACTERPGGARPRRPGRHARRHDRVRW